MLGNALEDVRNSREQFLDVGKLTLKLVLPGLRRAAT